MKPPELSCRLLVRICGEKPFFGPGLFRLLELVSETGSLQNSAEKMGMSYSKAWKRIKEAEKELGFSLLRRQIGGAGGGSSVPTPECTDFVRRYGEYQKELTETAGRLFSQYFRS